MRLGLSTIVALAGALGGALGCHGEPPLGEADATGRAGATGAAGATANLWFVQKLARLAEKLQASSNGTSTLLDDATIFFGSEMHGSNHSGLDLPVVTVGKGGGRLATNQSLDFANSPRHTERLANLHLTFLRGVFDLTNQTFGTSLPQNPVFGTAPAFAYGAGTTVIPEILA